MRKSRLRGVEKQLIWGHITRKIHTFLEAGRPGFLARIQLALSVSNTEFCLSVHHSAPRGMLAPRTQVIQDMVPALGRLPVWKERQACRQVLRLTQSTVGHAEKMEVGPILEDQQLLSSCPES